MDTRKNWFITSQNDTINLDYVSNIQLDGVNIYVCLGLGNGTSGSNALITYTYGSAALAEADYVIFQEALKKIAVVTDLRDADFTITSITPNTGTTAGGIVCDIAGTGFTPGCTVTIDGVACVIVSVISDVLITIITPAGSAGAKDVVITDVDPEKGSITLAASYTYT